jgi:hypothetical protein
MATRVILTPNSAEFPASNFPQLMTVNNRPVLAFDAATNEACQWTFVAPQGLTGAITAIISYIMASAVSGDVDVDVALEAVSDGDAVDLDAGDSFDSVNSVDNTTVPGTAGYIDQISVTLTNADSIAAGDLCRVQLTRDAASDSAAGDMYVLGVELRDGA